MITTENKTRRNEQTFSEIKRLSAANLDGPELLRRVAQRLSKAVPFEAYCASTVDPASRLITYGIAEGMGGESDEFGNVYLDRIYFEEDLPVMNEMLRRRRTVQLLSETTGGALERSLRYRELLRPYGFGYEMGGAFVDGNLWGGMDLIREEGDPDFGGAEAALVSRIAPHVGAGLKAAALRSRATTEQDSPDVLPGVLTLDRTGKIISHTPSAKHWLSDLEDLDPHWRHENIPMAVRMVSGALRHALAPGSDSDHNLIPRVRVRGRSGRWLALYGSLTEPSGDRPGETVIVIGPAKPEEVAWLTVAAYSLSPREKEVVDLLVRSFTNRQISRALFISEHTVQRHLSNIFEKVGVRSRKTLLKRLYFENLLPSLVDD